MDTSANEQPIVKTYAVLDEHISSMDNALDILQDATHKVITTERYTDEHKSEVFTEAKQTIINRVEDAYTRDIEVLEADITHLEGIVNYDPSIQDADAPKMLYTKDALQARWQSMSNADMASHWKNAIAHGDKMTARIYRDFAQSAMINKLPVSPVTNMRPLSDGNYDQLAKDTQAILHTDEQTQSTLQLDYARKMRLNLITSHNRAMRDLQGASYSSDGAIVSGRVLAMSELIQSFI